MLAYVSIVSCFTIYVDICNMSVLVIYFNGFFVFHLF